MKCEHCNCELEDIDIYPQRDGDRWIALCEGCSDQWEDDERAAEADDRAGIGD